ncbi:VOC family protein [Kibdelosporangium persicum]|uniref:Lactoylglutathione lyase n=2 Tax=Kibdelosporangium persicum TaxID=2698649 RepID=A0ABX2F2E0_9PSEU|nr:putative lactoylglutathione lyase [Kibdelosporangium persicum]
MPLQANVIMLGVQDVDRAKKFYAEGMGCRVKQEFPGFVRFELGDGSSDLALYGWDTVARDAGVSAEGSGFRGISLHFLVDSREAVDEVMRTAVASGATAVKEAAAAQWGGYDGHFSDPDGYLWKVVTAS